MQIDGDLYFKKIRNTPVFKKRSNRFVIPTKEGTVSCNGIRQNYRAADILKKIDQLSGRIPGPSFVGMTASWRA